VTLQQAGITFGFLIAFCANLFVQKVVGQTYDWRLALGLQCVIALFMLIGLAFMPESPRYLALRGDTEQAKVVLQKLRGKDNNGLVETEFSEIQEEISQSEANQSSWKEVFSRKLALCLLVGGFIPSISQFSGINAIMLYSSTIFNDLCIPGLVMTAVIGVVNFVFTFVSIFLSDRLGRKPLLITGASGMFVALVTASIVLWTTDYLTNTGAANGVVFLILYFIGKC
jgi:MFS family permease